MNPRILILRPEIENEWGGTERAAEALKLALQSAGFECDIHTEPFHWQPKELVPREMLRWSLLNLEADAVIPLRFPAYCVRHPVKIVWLNHQFRQVYDFFGTRYSGFSCNVPDTALRRTIVAMDRAFLAESRQIFASSTVTRHRLARYSGLEAPILHQPSLISEKIYEGPFGDYILAVGRLEQSKRFDLLLEALSRADAAISLVIAGDGAEKKNLEQQAYDLGIVNRVSFAGSVTDEQLVELYACCRAVHYTPSDEDYGLVTVEAMQAGKPVITASDAGGPLTFVRHSHNGLVAEPTPEAQAAAMSRLWNDLDACRTLGSNARSTVKELTWSHVVKEITACLP